MPASADLSREDTRELEELLVRLGMDPGPVDGIADAQTAAAIEDYQSFAALRVDGVASSALLEELRGVTESLGTNAESAPSEATPPSAVAATDDESGTTSQSGESAAPPPSGLVTGAPWDTAIHLASFRQESKAHTEWQRLQRRLPDLLGDMDSMISAFDLGDDGLFFRLYAGPFPNLATAQDFCVMMSLEGFRCGIARGDTMQVAAISPVAPEVPDGPEEQEAQPESTTEAEAVTEATAETEAVAVTEDQPSAPSASAESGEAIATPDASVGSDAPEPSPTIEASTAVEPPDATESAATDEEVAVAQVPEDDDESISPAQALAEPTEEDESSAVVGAPSVLVTAEQIGAATPDQAPEVATEVLTADATADATEDATEDVTEVVTEDVTEVVTADATEVVTEEGPSETVVGAPTILVAATQFGEASPSDPPEEAAEKGLPETAIGAPTLLVTAIDFGDEPEGANAEPEPEPAGSAVVQPMTDEPAEVETAPPDDQAAVSVTGAGESAAGEPTESENAEIEITATDDVTAEAAEAAPVDQAAAEATQTAALVATGTEDYATATAAFEIGDCSTALRYYERAFKKGGLPRRALASGHNNRGRCYYDRAHYDEALADFDRAVGLDREFAAAYYNRGRVHNAMGNGVQARSDLKSAYDLGFGRLQPLQ